jgi:superfamily II DNA/RNA helicase
LSSPTTRRARPAGNQRPHRSGGGRSGGTRPQADRPAPARPAVAEKLWTVPESGMPTFAELGLPTPIVDSLAARGFTEPFPIQAATLPDALAGRDLLGRAQTGSGKTLAFGLALLARMEGARSRPGQPRGLVLVPTRELAQQVVDALEPYAKALGLTTTAVVGGLSFSRQAAELHRGIDLLVATPGRLADHIEQRTCDLSAVSVTAIDEADRMADMGFLPQVRAILDRTPADGQRLLFSATLDGEVATLVRRYLTDPVTRSVASATGQVSTMDHHLLHVDLGNKPQVVTEIAARDGRTIMFVRTKHGVDRLVKILRRSGIDAGALHGGKAQNNRNRAIEAFKAGRTPVLVATDVAARGIHIDDVSLVVHVDPPADPKDYLHRAGRTARAGDSGTVVTLVTPPERSDVDKLARQAGIRPTQTQVVPGDPALARITGARAPSGVPVAEPPKPAPTPRGAGRGKSRSGRGRTAQPARQDGARQDGPPENRAGRRSSMTRAAFSSAQPSRRPRRRTA